MVSDISRAIYDPNWLEESLTSQRSVIGITDEQIDELKKTFNCISFQIYYTILLVVYKTDIHLQYTPEPGCVL